MAENTMERVGNAASASDRTWGDDVMEHVEALRKGIDKAARTELGGIGEAVLSKFPAVDMRIEHAHQEVQQLQDHVSGLAEIRHLDGEAVSRMVDHGMDTAAKKIDQLQQADSVRATELASEYLTGAVIGMTLPGKHIDKAEKVLDELEDAGKAAKHTPEAWKGDTNPDRAHDPAQMHGHRNGPVEIDGVVYEDGQAPRPVHRGPLELEPIDNPTATRPSPSAHVRRQNPAVEEDHTIRNVTIGVGATVATGVGYVAGKQYLENEERKDRVTLSDAYQAATSAPWEIPAAERNARFDAVIKAHPELKEALAGYKMVFDTALYSKDGKISQSDKEILNIVASNTSIEISKGNLDNIKVTSSAFENPKRDASLEAAPSWDYSFPER